VKPRAASLAGLVLAMASLPGRADPVPAPQPRWVPTATASLGSFDERLRVKIDGVDSDSQRSQLQTSFALGLAHPLAAFGDPRLWLDGHASLGLGVTFQTGHWQVPLREDVTFAFAAARWLTFRGGLGAGLTVDATSSSRSFAALAIPFGVTFWNTLEVFYRPQLTLPLGSETATVFGGERQLSTRLSFLPFECGLRLRLTALGR